jgi:hypothetical protein
MRSGFDAEVRQENAGEDCSPSGSDEQSFPSALPGAKLREMATVFFLEHDFFS